MEVTYKVHLVSLLFLVSFVSWTNGEAVTLYNHTFQYGDFLLLSVKGCTNVPKRFRDAASALDLHDGCLVFFDSLNCRGRRVVLQSHHKKYTDNLQSIGFNNAIKSVLPCGQKIRPGNHVIRNAMDGAVLTVKPIKDEFFADTMMKPWLRKETQVWKIGKYGPKIGVNYDLKPVSYPYYNPVTYQNFELPRQDSNGQPYMPPRFYEFKPLTGGKHIIKILHTDKCLYNKGMNKPVGKANCAPWLASQQWQFIRIDPPQPSYGGPPRLSGPPSSNRGNKPRVVAPLPVFL